MALSVVVKTYAGTVEDRYDGEFVWELCRLAHDPPRPFLGHVDPST